MLSQPESLESTVHGLGTSGNLIQIKVRCSREKEKLGSLFKTQNKALGGLDIDFRVSSEGQKGA